jgi:signal recognition particle GTPase
MKCEYCGEEAEKLFFKYFNYKHGYKEYAELLKVCNDCLYSDQKKRYEKNVNEEDKIEFTTRGKKQLRDVVYNEVKSHVNSIMEPMIDERIDIAIRNKLVKKDINYVIESKVERVVNEVYSKQIREMLREAGFEEKLKEEIIAYLHKKWSLDSIVFDEYFNKALMRAVKELIQ